MAINKKKASPALRFAIAAVAFVLVLSFVPWGSFGLFGNSSTSGNTATTQIDQINAQWAPSVASFDPMLASDPTSYTILVAVANTYSDWASAIQQETGGQTGQDRPIHVAAASFYDRALAVKSGDPAVATDAAISHYYSGDTANAIRIIEETFKASPEFAPARFNGAIFYRTAGRTADAVASLNLYLELDPAGASAEAAKSILAELGSASGDATVTP